MTAAAARDLTSVDELDDLNNLTLEDIHNYFDKSEEKDIKQKKLTKAEKSTKSTKMPATTATSSSMIMPQPSEQTRTPQIFSDEELSEIFQIDFSEIFGSPDAGIKPSKYKGVQLPPLGSSSAAAPQQPHQQHKYNKLPSKSNEKTDELSFRGNSEMRVELCFLFAVLSLL